MLQIFKNGNGSTILRVKILDSSSTKGAGLTGLTNSSSGLIISTIADNEATATVYTQAASHIQTIATLGTYAAPSASNCRFKEVDSTNHPGIYEIQIADARFAVSNAKSLLISISGAANVVETDAIIPLWVIDPYSLVQLDSAGLDNIVIETSLNARQAMSIMAAVLAGQTSGFESGTPAFAAAGVPATNRVTSVVSINNDRTTVTLNPPA